MAANREHRKTVEAAIAKAAGQGFVVKETKSGGWMVFEKAGTRIVTVHGTPSDRRGVQNALAALRRIGVEI